MMPEDVSTQSPIRLSFEPEAKKLLTPFRKHALERLFEIGCRELGSSLKSATVEVDDDHWEPTPPKLDLFFVADIDGYEWSRAHKAIVEAEVELEASWTDAERADSAKMITYMIFPLRI